MSIVKGQIGFQTHSACQSTPVTIDTMLNLYRAKFKINSVSVRVNKASIFFTFNVNGKSLKLKKIRPFVKYIFVMENYKILTTAQEFNMKYN